MKEKIIVFFLGSKQRTNDRNTTVTVCSPKEIMESGRITRVFTWQRDRQMPVCPHRGKQLLWCTYNKRKSKPQNKPRIWQCWWFTTTVYIGQTETRRIPQHQEDDVSKPRVWDNLQRASLHKCAKEVLCKWRKHIKDMRKCECIIFNDGIRVILKKTHLLEVCIKYMWND